MRSRRMKRETAGQDVSRVRVRGAGARLQGRSHARPVSDRARQDSPEPVVGHVCATSAPARHRDQAGAPARVAALHQGVRRLKRWRLAAGVLLFAALAPVSLVALPFAALLVAAQPETRGEWLAVALAGGAGVTLLVARTKAGPALWTEVQWEATRDASRSVRYLVEVAPGLYPAFEPAVRLLAAWPLWLVVESLAGLALAWRGHTLIARTPLSA